MKGLLLALALTLCSFSSLQAQADDLHFYVHTPGTTPDGDELTGSYVFPATSLGDASRITLRMRNLSRDKAYVVVVFDADTVEFQATGFATSRCVAPSSSPIDMNLVFQPSKVGQAAGTISVRYLAAPASSGCPSEIGQDTILSDYKILLSGAGIPAQWTVAYAGSDSVSRTVQSGDVIDFGNITLTQTASVSVTISNQGTSALNMPAVSIPSGTTTNPFALSRVPATTVSILPGASTSFTLTFAPGQATLAQHTLVIGTRQYTLRGFGVLGTGTASLVISYTDPGGTRSLIQGSSTIPFGRTPVGTPVQMIITVRNPGNSSGPVTLPSVAVSGTGFAMTGSPQLTLNPNEQTLFQIRFTPATAGDATGTLSIGNLQFSLTGSGTTVQTEQPGLDLSIQFDRDFATSQQQAKVTVQSSNPARSLLIATLSMQFTSSVNGVADDPAIRFLDTNSRSLNLQLAAGAQTAVFVGRDFTRESQTFQTGSTAGLLTFKLELADGTSLTKSLRVSPAQVTLSEASAEAQASQVVVTLSGYDNTYTASGLTFFFFDRSGAQLTPNGIKVDVKQAFQNFFYDSTNRTGGAFVLQAKFPVTGDISKIGAVDVSVENVQGTTFLKH